MLSVDGRAEATGGRADGSDRGLPGCHYGERGASGGGAKEKKDQEKNKKEDASGGVSGTTRPS